MNALTSLMDGFGTALTPINLLWAAIGVLLGTAIGVLPGIGPAMAVALLLPVTYGLDPIGAFIMFAGIYYGAMFGGSTTSILLNTPESAAVVAAMEGNPMAKSGRGAQALAAAAIGHFAGGMIGTAGQPRRRLQRADSRVGRGDEHHPFPGDRGRPVDGLRHRHRHPMTACTRATPATRRSPPAGTRPWQTFSIRASQVIPVIRATPVTTPPAPRRSGPVRPGRVATRPR
ncbi:hypothetical protein SHIRM173S_01448 [Streptomyces hirsutus]